MTENPQTSLLPCPFCGRIDLVKAHGNSCRTWVECIYCNVVVHDHGNHKTAREAWNTRPTPIQEGEVGEAVKTLEMMEAACLCDRHTKGFDYGEVHENLGKAGIGKRWNTPTEIYKEYKRTAVTVADNDEVRGYLENLPLNEIGKNELDKLFPVSARSLIYSAIGMLSVKDFRDKDKQQAIEYLKQALTAATEGRKPVEATFVEINNIIAEAMLRFSNSVDVTKFVLEMLKERNGIWFLKDESPLPPTEIVNGGVDVQ